MHKEDKLFEEFIQSYLRRYFPNVVLMSSSDKKIIEETARSLFLNTLIFLINEKSSSMQLIGSTPEDRYTYFDTYLCKKNLILDEVEQRFPEIIKRISKYLDKYFHVKKYITSCFIRDYEELVVNNFIANTEELEVSDRNINIKIFGDIHNGSGVSLITFGNEKIIYKQKNVYPNKLIQDIETLFRTKLQYDLDIIPKFLKKDGYYWEKYVSNKPISEDFIRTYYIKIGYLLSLAYMLNISDLHFENIISTSDGPMLVDVETILSILPYPNEKENTQITQILNDKEKNSVISTGLLPIAHSSKIFGGDTSGIMGGKFIREIKNIKNQFRDDICIRREVETTYQKKHLPYYLHNNKELYVDASKYYHEIIEGFSEISKLFIENKQQIIKLLDKYKNKILTRILFRNTKDYSLVRSLLLSPAYSGKEHLIFNKMREKLSNFPIDKLLLSEKKQLLNLDIPYFEVCADSINVTNKEMEIVWTLDNSPINIVKQKIIEFNEEELNFQSQLIEFSITCMNDVKKHQQGDYRKYKIRSGNSVADGITQLFDIIESNEVHSNCDNTSNWLSVSVGDYDNLELKPMKYSIYNGLSGLALSLYETYPLLDKKRQYRLKSMLSGIQTTLLKEYSSISDNSFYLGKLGVLYTLKKLNELLDTQVSDRWINSEVENCYRNIPFNIRNDIMGGLSDYILSLQRFEGSKQKIVCLGQQLINNVQSTNQFNYWDNLLTNNVSFAHGNAGIEVALYSVSNTILNAKVVLDDALKFEKFNQQNFGWYDYRNHSHSANWCHGSTGVLISRTLLLKMNEKLKLLTLGQVSMMKEEINHAISDVLDVGLDIENFSICHGVSGNLLALHCFERSNVISNSRMREMIRKEFIRMHNYGLRYGWLCGYGTNFESFGLFTGIAGVLYASARYIQNKSDFGILTPSID